MEYLPQIKQQVISYWKVGASMDEIAKIYPGMSKLDVYTILVEAKQVNPPQKHTAKPRTLLELTDELIEKIRHLLTFNPTNEELRAAMPGLTTRHINFVKGGCVKPKHRSIHIPYETRKQIVATYKEYEQHQLTQKEFHKLFPGISYMSIYRILRDAGCILPRAKTDTNPSPKKREGILYKHALRYGNKRIMEEENISQTTLYRILREENALLLRARKEQPRGPKKEKLRYPGQGGGRRRR